VNLKSNPPAGRHTELPAGTADLLPAAAERLIALRRSLLDAMALWGYRPVAPPLIEHAEVFAQAFPDADEELSFYKFVDRATGRMLSIRADFTPQVARIAATRFGPEALPLRLSYDGPVARHVPAQRGRRRELYQVGAELLGVSDPEGDAECIALAAHCLARVELSSFTIDVGQVEFFKGILGDAGLGDADARRITDAVAKKDLSGLERLLPGLALSDAKKRLLAELPLLAGGAEVLDRASELAENDHSRRALENLARVVEYVTAQGWGKALAVDLGEIRGVDYHTGVIFEAFVPHLGVPLVSGGRYDGLVGAFGAPLPATGFSLDLFAAAEALSLEHPGRVPAPVGVYVINYLPARDAALELARALREKNVRACRDLVRRPLEESLGAARAQNFAWALALGAEGCPEGHALLVELATGKREILPIERARERVGG
jgi:ATP phosphoribosyltransferase regulatory subunit